jgi:hypothetical protein
MVAARGACVSLSCASNAHIPAEDTSHLRCSSLAFGGGLWHWAGRLFGRHRSEGVHGELIGCWPNNFTCLLLTESSNPRVIEWPAQLVMYSG